jgi:hypothetical protein
VLAAALVEAPGPHWDGHWLRERQTFDRPNQLIDEIAQALFDAVSQRLLGVLVFCSHADA